MQLITRNFSAASCYLLPLRFMFLCSLFSNTLDLRPSFNMEDKVHNDDKTSNKIIVLYILKFILPHSKQEEKKILAQIVANIP
jgi:hypothetical protein